MPLTGHNLSIRPVTVPQGVCLARKIQMIPWFARNGFVLLREAARADAIHAPIPGDIGTIGMLIAFTLRKPLFVRHCGNWLSPRTTAEHFWKWFMERFGGGRNVMLATGGAGTPPSSRNPAVRWIFSTSLTEDELAECAARREPPAPGNARLIIACRQERGKGTGVVIESLPTILRGYPGACLEVVGDGAALAEFRARATDLGIADRVTFHGRVSHARVIQLLQQADLFCYPTTSSEGFPKVVLEALACGLPVVTTPVSVLPQVIGTGCGLLLESATPAATAKAVHACLSDGERYREMSARAVDTAASYSLERWRDTIRDLLWTSWNHSGRP